MKTDEELQREFFSQTTNLVSELSFGSTSGEESAMCRPSVGGDENEGVSLTTLAHGDPGTLAFRLLFFNLKGKLTSPWSEVPLYSADCGLHCVCLSPAGTWGEFEVAMREPSNPLRLRARRGRPGHYAYNTPWHVAMLPQTWGGRAADVSGTFLSQDFCKDDILPRHESPVEIIDISPALPSVTPEDSAPGQGSRRGVSFSTARSRGDVYSVKVLGAFVVVDPHTREVAWKILGIDTRNEVAGQLADVADVHRLVPGVLEEVREWLRVCHCLEFEDQECSFGLGECAADHAEAMGIVAQTHATWQLMCEDPSLWPALDSSRLGTANAKDTGGSILLADPDLGFADEKDDLNGDSGWPSMEDSTEGGQPSASLWTTLVSSLGDRAEDPETPAAYVDKKSGVASVGNGRLLERPPVPRWLSDAVKKAAPAYVTPLTSPVLAPMRRGQLAEEDEWQRSKPKLRHVRRISLDDGDHRVLDDERGKRGMPGGGHSSHEENSMSTRRPEYSKKLLRTSSGPSSFLVEVSGSGGPATRHAGKGTPSAASPRNGQNRQGVNSTLQLLLDEVDHDISNDDSSKGEDEENDDTYGSKLTNRPLLSPMLVGTAKSFRDQRIREPGGDGELALLENWTGVTCRSYIIPLCGTDDTSISTKTPQSLSQQIPNIGSPQMQDSHSLPSPPNSFDDTASSSHLKPAQDPEIIFGLSDILAQCSKRVDTQAHLVLSPNGTLRRRKRVTWGWVEVHEFELPPPVKEEMAACVNHAGALFVHLDPTSPQFKARPKQIEALMDLRRQQNGRGREGAGSSGNRFDEDDDDSLEAMERAQCSHSGGFSSAVKRWFLPARRGHWGKEKMEGGPSHVSPVGV
eukprot:TRINITY_DN9260_c0_g1_i1.p1 TRINITY_DN9260_c0_g1~~TRINITY_DN9260_c0_g1_i1.p1  ORF type:complete len:858 (+),score=115.16 TRINITY_DN9260_c0_g1_i1:1532-4105(+)